MPGIDHRLLQRIRTQAYKYKLWGSNFGADDGTLDERLSGADRLKTVLLPILVRMGDTLTILAERLNKKEELAYVCRQIIQLGNHVSASIITPGAYKDDDETDAYPAISLEDLSSTGSDCSSLDEQRKLEELVQDLQSHNACLYGLGSVIQDSAERLLTEPGNASQERDPMTQKLFENPAWPYISSVMEKYPSIKPDFARRFGEARLSTVVSRSNDGRDENLNAQEQMQEEKDSTLKCLEICDSVSYPVTVLQQKASSHASASSNSDERLEHANRPAVCAWLAAASNLTGYRNQLQSHLQRLTDKSKQPVDGSDPENAQVNKEDLLREISSLQQSIDICEDASKEANRNRANVFENVSIDDNGRQFIASTVDNLISARKIIIGSCSVQNATSDRDEITSKESLQRPKLSGENFEGRYGAGRDLRL